MSTSDGSTADYYQLPAGSTELQHLISHRDMNAQIGEIFRACYRYGIASHSSRLRDAKKIRFYIEAEIARLEALQPAFDWEAALVEQDQEEAALLTCPECGVTEPDNHQSFCSWRRPVATEEPAAQIDDESDRQQAVEQNGNDGAVYDDPWYGAPEWARFKAQDQDGEWRWFGGKPTLGTHRWYNFADNSKDDSACWKAATPTWRETLIERTSG